jgi:hypothetical protein
MTSRNIASNSVYLTGAVKRSRASGTAIAMVLIAIGARVYWSGAVLCSSFIF